MANEAPTTDQLLALAKAGDGAAWGALLTAEQERLVRMVAFRMDSRFRSRVDAVDIVQDAFAEAAEHREAYFRLTGTPMFLWLRGVVGNKLLEVHRRHLGTHMRDIKREQSLDAPQGWDDTASALWAHLTGQFTSPSIVAVRDEVKTRLAAALNDMSPIDREMLVLRHFEQLTSLEAAQVLGIQERAAAKRYLRALERLKVILSEMPGGLTEVRL